MQLRRYWIEFDLTEVGTCPLGIETGCGITAYNHDDMLHILRTALFPCTFLPAIMTCIENVDTSTLDAKHVIPNMHPPVKRGIWFPQGFAETG